MKVIEVPFCFYPDPVGGTEIYVKSLSLRLQRYGIEVVVAAPTTDSLNKAYFYEGLPVRRFRASRLSKDLVDLYGEGDKEAAEAFGDILDEERPDLVHLHAFTAACSLRTVRETRVRGIPVLFTYHTPTVSCQRGTLLRWGSETCDGLLDVHVCSSCYLQSLGLGKVGGAVVGHLPSRIGALVGAAGFSGGVWTALRMTQLVQLRHDSFQALMREVEHVIAVCDWVRELLLRNGLSAQKVTVSRQGFSGGDPDSVRGRESRLSLDSPVRLVFLGRMDITKGPDILIRALVSLPHVPIEVHLYGIVQDEAGRNYLKQLKAVADGDPRISFHPPVQNYQVVSTLTGYDLLAVPSRVLETGPLVVLEAFAAGIPVLGSRLGGIAELVEDGVDGLLVDPHSVSAWIAAMRRLVEDRELLRRLRAGVRPPRRMEAVALEMKALYERMCELRVRVSGAA